MNIDHDLARVVSAAARNELPIDELRRWVGEHIWGLVSSEEVLDRRAVVELDFALAEVDEGRAPASHLRDVAVQLRDEIANRRPMLFDASDLADLPSRIPYFYHVYGTAAQGTSGANRSLVLSGR